MLREIAADELEPLAIGAWILGAGGGGSPYLAYLNIRLLYRQGTRLQLMNPMALADDDMVAVVSNMGAPLVGQERLSDPAFAAKPVRMMADYLGTPFRAVMAVEIGGGKGNSCRRRGRAGPGGFTTQGLLYFGHCGLSRSARNLRRPVPNRRRPSQLRL